jgi:hypothetical protein
MNPPEFILFWANGMTGEELIGNWAPDKSAHGVPGPSAAKMEV